MRIVKAGVEFLPGSSTPDPVYSIWRAGIVAYMSERNLAMLDRAHRGDLTVADDQTMIKFVKSLTRLKHDSVLEHAILAFEIVCDRGVSHELVCHRHISKTQESTRYVNYADDRFGKDISVICPPGLSRETMALWTDSCLKAESAYMAMIDAGVSPQLARSVLPTCTKTQMVTTMNVTAFRHFVTLRTAPMAHPQMQEIAKLMYGEIMKRWPVLVEDIEVKE
jgi:thymidylate synthase (FAD)